MGVVFLKAKLCMVFLLFFALSSGIAFSAKKKKNIEDFSPDERAKLTNLRVLSNNPFPDGSFRILGTVTGTSCKRNAYGRDASEGEAESALRMEAAQLGADAVVNTAIQERGVSWRKNCWQTIVAVGDAIQITNPEMLRQKVPSTSSDGVPLSGGVSLGTGWVAGPCLIVTNYHIIEGHATFSAVLQSGQKLSLRLIQKDTVNDLAVLVPMKGIALPSAIPFAQDDIRQGTRVFTIGFPHPDVMGDAPKLTDGIVNATTGVQDDPRFFQVSVPIQSGNSGGPVLNMNGEVIGVATSKLNAAAMYKLTGDLTENVGYALKVHYLRPLVSAISEVPGECKALSPQASTLEVLADRIKPSVLLMIAE